MVLTNLIILSILFNKIRVNNPLRTTVEQMNINSVTNKFDALCSIFKQKVDKLLVYETKIDDIFPLAQFL